MFFRVKHRMLRHEVKGRRRRLPCRRPGRIRGDTLSRRSIRRNVRGAALFRAVAYRSERSLSAHIPSSGGKCSLLPSPGRKEKNRNRSPCGIGSLCPLHTGKGFTASRYNFASAAAIVGEAEGDYEDRVQVPGKQGRRRAGQYCRSCRYRPRC